MWHLHKQQCAMHVTQQFSEQIIVLTCCRAHPNHSRQCQAARARCHRGQCSC
jgi:hypothetical protein